MKNISFLTEIPPTPKSLTSSPEGLTQLVKQLIASAKLHEKADASSSSCNELWGISAHARAELTQLHQMISAALKDIAQSEHYWG